MVVVLLCDPTIDPVLEKDFMADGVTLRLLFDTDLKGVCVPRLDGDVLDDFIGLVEGVNVLYDGVAPKLADEAVGEELDV